MCMSQGDVYRNDGRRAEVLAFTGEGDTTAIVKISSPTGVRYAKGWYSKLYDFDPRYNRVYDDNTGEVVEGKLGPDYDPAALDSLDTISETEANEFVAEFNERMLALR